MVITIDLLATAVCLLGYYLTGIAIVLSINAFRASREGSSLSWSAFWRNLQDPMLYVALLVWPWFFVTEAWEFYRGRL